jgi:hypothetical protein
MIAKQEADERNRDENGQKAREQRTGEALHGFNPNFRM